MDAAGYDARHRTVTEDQRLVCRWRPDGILTFVSEAYCRYFGKGRDELLGRSVWPLRRWTVGDYRVFLRLSVAHI